MSRPALAEAVVFAGYGQLVWQWGESLESADAPPTMIVAVHRLSDEMLRLHEYSPGFEPERFAAHEKFFVEDVRGWVRARFGVGRGAGPFPPIPAWEQACWQNKLSQTPSWRTAQ